MEIIVAFSAGLFSLLGAFAGAALARETEHKKWLRENRSEVFTKFLNLLSDSRKNATDAMFDETLKHYQQEIKVTEIYLSPLNYARVVCLYLPKEKRQEFRLLAQDFYALHASRTLGDSRLATMEEKLEAIQNIFEANL